jgi:hypothetical protein
MAGILDLDGFGGAIPYFVLVHILRIWPPIRTNAAVNCDLLLFTKQSGPSISQSKKGGDLLFCTMPKLFHPSLEGALVCW